MKHKCGYCGGTGRVECDCTGGCGTRYADEDCPMCLGKGVHFCPECNGTGQAEDED